MTDFKLTLTEMSIENYTKLTDEQLELVTYTHLKLPKVIDMSSKYELIAMIYFEIDEDYVYNLNKNFNLILLNIDTLSMQATNISPPDQHIPFLYKEDIKICRALDRTCSISNKNKFITKYCVTKWFYDQGDRFEIDTYAVIEKIDPENKKINT